MYGWETWPHTLKDKHSLRVFENKMLWRTFVTKRDEGIREWRRLHNDKRICMLTKYISDYKVKNNDMGGACSTYGRRGEVHAWFWWGNLKEIEIYNVTSV